MQRVTGLDEMYLSLDTGRTVGHIAGIALFDAPREAVAPGARLAFLRRRIGERLPALPLLRWRLRTVPLWIDQRRWAEVSAVDLDLHVHQWLLPEPGGDAEFHLVLDRIMAEALPRDRPLWAVHLVEGFADGRYAFIVKLSHGLADGSALWAVLDLLSDRPGEPVVPTPHAPEPRFGTLELLARGALGWVSTPVRGLALQAQTARWAGTRLAKDKGAAIPATLARLVPGEFSRPLERLANRARGEGDTVEVASMVPTLRPPRTPLSGDVTTDLGVAWIDLSLADLRRIGKLVDGTINDAILALTAGALRRYLAGHGGIPDRPLTASAPISWRTGHERDRWANHVWMLFLPLPTHLDSPAQRLRAARTSASVAKATWDGLPMHLMRPASALMPTWQIGPGAWLMSRMPARLVPALYNVAVSNVKGPAEIPVYDGQPIGRYLVYGFLPPGIGLLLGGQSLGDRFVLCATAARSVVPDVEILPALLREEFDELLTAASRHDLDEPCPAGTR